MGKDDKLVGMRIKTTEFNRWAIRDLARRRDIPMEQLIDEFTKRAIEDWYGPTGMTFFRHDFEVFGPGSNDKK